jgi:hypothetical protein
MQNNQGKSDRINQACSFQYHLIHNIKFRAYWYRKTHSTNKIN